MPAGERAAKVGVERRARRVVSALGYRCGGRGGKPYFLRGWTQGRPLAIASREGIDGDALVAAAPKQEGRLRRTRPMLRKKLVSRRQRHVHVRHSRGRAVHLVAVYTGFATRGAWIFRSIISSKAVRIV